MKMIRNAGVLGFAASLLFLTGCRSTYYATMEKFGVHKRDMLKVLPKMLSIRSSASSLREYTVAPIIDGFPFPPFYGPTVVESGLSIFSCSFFQSPQVIDTPESCGACSGCNLPR